MHKKYHLDEQPIPEGYRIYEERLDVRGVQHRRADAISFARARGQWLEFEREPRNTNDLNAIKVLGCWRGFFFTKRKHIGYVSRETAARVVETAVSDVRPRLLKTYVGHDGYVEIEFQIIGPADSYREYDPFSDAPIDRVRKHKEDGNLEEAAKGAARGAAQRRGDRRCPTDRSVRKCQVGAFRLADRASCTCEWPRAENSSGERGCGTRRCTIDRDRRPE